MRLTALPIVLATLALAAACSGPVEDEKHSQADAVEAAGERRADALEQQADAAATPAQAQALEQQADAAEDTAEQKAEAMREQIDKEH